MSTVTFENDTIEIIEGDSVLETLLDAGYDVPFSCQAGVCHCCMLQAVTGTPPSEAQRGLKDSEIAEGCFLACQCHPEEDLEVALRTSRSTRTGILAKKQQESGNVLRLWIKSDLEYQSGQFVSLIRKDGLSRSYSIASVPGEDDLLEFQIRLYPDGQFSQWANTELQVGDEIEIEGPFGECYYTNSNPQQPLLLAGVGTGLAPLYGIIRDAIRQGHQGPIRLFLGARRAGSLYLQEQLRTLESKHSQFSYTPVLLEDDKSIPRALTGDLNEVMQAELPDLNGYRVYLCGSAERMTNLRKQCFLSGASMRDIHVDLFTPAG